MEELKNSPDARTTKKLMCLNLRAELKLPAKEIGKLTGYSKSRVDDIISEYCRFGLEAIRSKPQGGNNRSMPQAKEAELISRFDKESEKGRMLEISDIYKAFQSEPPRIHLGTVYRILHRNGWRKVMPRSKHPKSDPIEQEAYKKTTEKIKELEKAYPNLVVGFMDEAGFGRINKPKRCWCRKGIRPRIPCHHVREYIYAYAAVFPATGGLVMLLMPKCNTVCMNIFLEQVSRDMAGKQVLLFMDRAAWHTSGALVIPDNIFIEYLLPYSPELNPTENLWMKSEKKALEMKCLPLWIGCKTGFPTLFSLSFVTKTPSNLLPFALG